MSREAIKVDARFHLQLSLAVPLRRVASRSENGKTSFDEEMDISKLVHIREKPPSHAVALLYKGPKQCLIIGSSGCILPGFRSGRRSLFGRCAARFTPENKSINKRELSAL